MLCESATKSRCQSHPNGVNLVFGINIFFFYERGLELTIVLVRKRNVDTVGGRSGMVNTGVLE